MVKTVKCQNSLDKYIMSLFELCKKLSPFTYNVEHTLSLIALNPGYKEITRLSLALGIFLENAIYKERK